MLYPRSWQMDMTLAPEQHAVDVQRWTIR